MYASWHGTLWKCVKHVVHTCTHMHTPSCSVLCTTLEGHVTFQKRKGQKQQEQAHCTSGNGHCMWSYTETKERIGNPAAACKL